MELFTFQQPSPHPAAEGRVRQVVEDKDRLKNTPEFPHRTIKVVPRPTGEQPFEGHRRGRLTRRKGSEELAHAVPVRGDPVKMQGALGLTDEGCKWSIRLLGIDTVYPLVMQAPDTRAKALAKHRKGGKVQFDITVCIRIVFLRVKIGLMIEQAVENIRGIALRALNGHRVERRIVVSNERVELQGKIAHTVAVGPPQDPLREEKALPIAAGGGPIAPHLRGIERQHRIDDIGKSRPEGLVMQIPVGNTLDVLVADAL